MFLVIKAILSSAFCYNSLMSLFILFGLPGAGKTYVGKVFQEDFNYTYHDADDDLPPEMQKALIAQTAITDSMRDKFFQNIVKTIKQLRKKYSNIVIAQTFIKEKYRKWILYEFHDAQFILIQTETRIRESRLIKRIDHPLDMEYARQMCRNFDEPEISYQTIDNNTEGTGNIKKQLEELFRENG